MATNGHYKNGKGLLPLPLPKAPAKPDFATYRDLMDGFRGVRDEVRAMLASSEKETLKSVTGVVLARLREEIEKRMDAVEQRINQRFYELAELIKSMPTPQVHVAVPQQAPPNVDVHVPEQQAPVVHVAVPEQPTPHVHVAVPEQQAPQVHVNIPEQQAPVVHVAVPEQQAPQVHVTVPEQQVTVNVPEGKPADIKVNVPPPRRLRKEIEYNEMGQPVVIEEVEVD